MKYSYTWIYLYSKVQGICFKYKLPKYFNVKNKKERISWVLFKIEVLQKYPKLQKLQTTKINFSLDGECSCHEVHF